MHLLEYKLAYCDLKVMFEYPYILKVCSSLFVVVVVLIFNQNPCPSSVHSQGGNDINCDFSVRRKKTIPKKHWCSVQGLFCFVFIAFKLSFLNYISHMVTYM